MFWDSGFWDSSFWAQGFWETGAAPPPDVAIIHNLRLVHTIVSDEAVLAMSGGVLATGYNIALTNIQSPIRDAIWRTTNTVTTVISGHWNGQDRTIGFCGLFRHLLHGAQVQLQLYSDQSLTSQVYDSTALDAAQNLQIDSFVWGLNSTSQQYTDLLYYAQPFVHWLTPQQCQGFKITISGAPLAQSYYQIGRLVLGPYFEMERDPDFGLALSWQNNDVRFRSTGGSQRTTFGRRWRRLEFDLSAMTENDRAKWLHLQAYAGNSRDLVVSVFPERGTLPERDCTLNGRLVETESLRYTFRTAGGLRSGKRVAFEEN